MPDAATSVFTPWAAFYTVTASAAAALIGLMFVVITLVTGEERRQNAGDGIAAFSTPTVVHFGSALFFSALAIVPWPSLGVLATIAGVAGAGGVVYVVRTIQRTKRLTRYDPDAEDWAWYSLLPLLAYGAILAAAIGLPWVPAQTAYGLAGGVLLLVFIGIHNAWDIVTYITIGPR
jgi:hypothetical protein